MAYDPRTRMQQTLWMLASSLLGIAFVHAVIAFGRLNGFCIPIGMSPISWKDSGYFYLVVTGVELLSRLSLSALAIQSPCQ